MTLPTSGALSLTDIQTEFGGSNPIGLNEYYAGGTYVPSGTTGTNGAVPTSGQISISSFYGTSNYYTISKSLRFRNSASSYLNRTYGTPTNQKIWTFSAWVKRGLLGITNGGTSYALFGCDTSGDNPVGFLGTDCFTFQGIQSGVTSAYLVTNQVFQDTSAWYHIVIGYDSTQATASNRIKLYVNGTQITSFSAATYPAQNANLPFNGASVAHSIGKYAPSGAWLFDGEMANVYWIDGQALTPSSFGTTNSNLGGMWQPIAYTGTYGNNGCFLPFTNTTSTSTLGNDSSGNGNNWTTNNFSLTAGSTYDSLTDVPTLTSATTANYCVLNQLLSGVVLQNGNLALGSNSGSYSTSSTFYVNSGKWYWEVINLSSIGGGLGITIAGASNTYLYNQPNCYGYYYNGQKRSQAGGNQSYGASYGAGDTIGIALDMDAGTITFYKNNVSQGIAYSGLSGYYCPATDTYPTGISFNFGQQPYIYTPPTGFVALNTYNL